MTLPPRAACRRERRISAFVVVALGFAAPLCLAQQLPREPGFGRVLDEDGQPWVDAKVFLEHRSHLLVVDEAYVDRLEATTDERGQFSVEMLPASAYSVWARSAVGEDGTYRRTGVVLDAVARSPIQMAEEELGFIRRLRVAPAADDDSWAGVKVRYVLRHYVDDGGG